MARSFPNELANDYYDDPRRTAELRVYEALREQLGSKWVVFYSVAWLGRTYQEGEPRDGEADLKADSAMTPGLEPVRDGAGCT